MFCHVLQSVQDHSERRNSISVSIEDRHIKEGIKLQNYARCKYYNLITTELLRRPGFFFPTSYRLRAVLTYQPTYEHAYAICVSEYV